MASEPQLLMKSGVEGRRSEVLGATKSSKPDATETLLRALTDPDPIIRGWAVEGLVARKDAQEQVIAALLHCLSADTRADLRWYAARALGKLGVHSDEVGGALRTALSDPDEYVRSFAAWALGQLRFTDPKTFTVLQAHIRGLTTKKTVEYQSVGVALARLHTRPLAGVAEATQQVLFPELHSVDQHSELPKTRQILVDELRRMSETLVTDRGGTTSTPIKRGVTLGVRFYRSVAAKSRAEAIRGPHCQLCGFTFLMETGGHYHECHHIVPVSVGGSDDDGNLLILCSNHHRQLHYASVRWPDGMRAPKRIVINGDPLAIRWARDPSSAKGHLGETSVKLG